VKPHDIDRRELLGTMALSPFMVLARNSAARAGEGQSATNEAITLNAKPEPLAIEPRRAAVIVVDMQNDCGAKGGMFDRAGIDISGIQAAASHDPGAVGALFELLKDAAAPIAIVGGADWSPRAAHHFANFAFRHGIPVAAAFRRQDAIPNSCGVYAGQLGYGPNPKLQQRIREADLILAAGPRLGEATTDGFTLITPDHPGQILVHVHPDPNELGHIFHADLPICADMGEFSEMVDEWNDPDLVPFSCGEDAHREWLEWSDPKPRDGVKLDLGPCVAMMREKLPENTIVCNGAGNFSGWWHRYWRYGCLPTQLAPTSGTMGYGLPAAVAAAIRFRDRPVVCVAGDGDFLMNGQELATAAQHGADLLVILVDNGAYGTIRMHQEREYPERISGTQLDNPDFAALARAFGGWAETVETTADFAPALDRALAQRGIRLLHCKTDVEQITNATTISTLREKAKA